MSEQVPQPQSPRQETLLAVASFLVIFSFSTVDSAISPLVQVLKGFFEVAEPRVLYLISLCTLGTVSGIIVGPALTASFPIRSLLLLSGAGLSGGLCLFLLSDRFLPALAARGLFGLSSGLFASCMWWVTFYGVSRSGSEKMITVLMSARPLATALGVPLTGMLAGVWFWKFSFWAFFGLLGLGVLLLVGLSHAMKNSHLEPFSPGKVLRDYQTAFRIPFATAYYLGFTLNRMCYFGFYVLAGIWFHRHYGASLGDISRALLLIGLAEAGVNFFVPVIRRHIGHRTAFHGCLWCSILLFPLFIHGSCSYPLALGLITIFMMLDRIYCMSLVITLPEMFPGAQNKTVFGSLNTLTAWAALTLISLLAGRFLDSWGLPAMQHLLWALFFVGSLLLIYVQQKTVGAVSPVSRTPEAGNSGAS